MKGKSLIALILSLVIISGTLVVAFIGIGTEKAGSAEDINLGLDLAGGVSITYTTVKDNPTDQELNDTKYKLTQRITAEGYTEGEVYREGDKRINVDIPNVADASAVLAALGEPGDLKFIDNDGTIVITGSDVKDANVVKGDIGYDISLELNKAGTAKFKEGTEKNVGKPIHIVYNGEVLMSPTVQQVITEGRSSISGMGTYENAEKMASTIRIGALPLELEELSSNVVGAKMGQDAINTSVKAGLVGILAVFAFMILFYRLPGVIASLALAFYAALMIVVISVTGITLTLPGIAGMILSVGMAVDANVIIFSRIKEEIALGKTLLASVKSGFKKATSAILDGNITTLIAAVVLYVMGTGTVRGFAQTLALGIVISMFTALVVTRILLINIVKVGVRNKKFYGIGHKAKVFDVIERKRLWFGISLAVIAIGFIMLPVNGNSKEDILNYDIEFVGGTSTTVTTPEVLYNNVDELYEDVEGLVTEATGDETPQLNVVRGVEGQGQFVIKTVSLDTDKGIALKDALIDKYDITQAEIESNNISATISSEMRRDAIIAVLIAAIGILLYTTFRFHDFRFGLAAVIALMHDVVVVFAVYSVLYIPINNSFIAAMLTIVGYSINDTIVLFDRVRENQNSMKMGDYSGVINLSISQTISRSINTSLTTFIMVLILNILGVASIREFALPLMVGIISGTYSSIFIASPLWYTFKRIEHKKLHKN